MGGVRNARGRLALHRHSRGGSWARGARVADRERDRGGGPMIAITRDVARSIQQAELTFVEPQRIDYVRASLQHREYRRVLADLGCEVISLPADDAYPDCVFVEDTAIVLSDLAVITRPGAESRRGETRAIADALEPYRPLVHIEAPATIDGGDVL